MTKRMPEQPARIDAKMMDDATRQACMGVLRVTGGGQYGSLTSAFEVASPDMPTTCPRAIAFSMEKRNQPQMNPDKRR